MLFYKPFFETAKDHSNSPQSVGGTKAHSAARFPFNSTLSDSGARAPPVFWPVILFRRIFDSPPPWPRHIASHRRRNELNEQNERTSPGETAKFV
jgi:hypothetical protein